MGNRGRPPKPSHLRVLEGNRSRRPIEPEPEFGGRPKKPRGLSKLEAKAWDAMVPPLADVGIATSGDQQLLEQMCHWWAVYISYKPDSYTDRQAMLTCSGAWKNFDAIASRFGMTPADRVKLKGIGNAKEQSKAKRFLA